MSVHLVYCILLLLSPSVVLSYSDNEVPENILETLKTDNPSLLVEHVVKEFFSNLLQNTNESCGSDWATLGNTTQVEKIIGNLGIRASDLVIALDSFGKPGNGFLRGNTKYMGNYDECLNIDTSSLNFSMQYCQLGVLFNISMNGSKPMLLQFTETICVPTSCTMENVPIVNLTLNHSSANIILDSFMCTPQEGVHFSTGSIIMIVVSCLFLTFSIVATIFDVVMYMYWWSTTTRCDNSFGTINDTFKPDCDEYVSLLGHGKKSNRLIVFLLDVAKGFSLYKTVPAILSTKQPPTAITSINGMRVISMFWVIMCHTYFFTSGEQGFSNIYDFTSFIPRFTAQPIMNGFFSVDSFFFLSGLLVAYLTFRHMKRNKGRFPFLVYYIHRILRITPTYMFVLFFYWLVTVHMGNGPNLLFSIGPDSVAAKSCQSYWWTNLLYINNFYPKGVDNCMGWSWYLANDMQFYVISPLLIIPLFYWFPAGIIAVCTLLLASFGVTGFIVGYYGYAANMFTGMMTTSLLPAPSNQPNEMDQIYFKPYCRIAPYLVGILLGYFLYRKFRIPVTNLVKGWLVHIVLWLVAAILGIINVYGLYPSWHGHELTTAENVLYVMFSRFTWGITLALVVFICHTGYGGVINVFLSLPIWIPLSRLTFNAYLVHEMVMTLLFSEMRDTLYYTDTIMVLYVVSIVVLSYGAAGVVSVFVEYPLSNLESAVFKLFGVPLQPSTRRVEECVNISSRDGTSPLEAAVRIG